MFYRAQNELIITSGRDENGSSISKYIHKEHKKNMWGKLNYIIGGEIRKNDLTTKYKNEYCHTVNDVFNYLPMILNYVKLLGRQKILFVGHFNAAQTNWFFLRKSDRCLFMSPTYLSGSEYMIDPNIWLQFLPIVAQSYGYLGDDFKIDVLSPPEWRNRQLMHALYRRYTPDSKGDFQLIPADKQYKHGVDSIKIDESKLSGMLYDTVVLAGVPKVDPDTQFTHKDIRNVFQPYCAPNFEIIDLNYQNKDASKYIGGARQNNEEYLQEVFVNRCIWDEQFAKRSSDDRKIEYQTLDTIIRRYKG